ncbi:hypothetical protein Tco_0739088 [Tanacetum coccineum]
MESIRVGARDKVVEHGTENEAIKMKPDEDTVEAFILFRIAHQHAHIFNVVSPCNIRQPPSANGVLQIKSKPPVPVGIESYQIKINLTKPTLIFSGIEACDPYSIIDKTDTVLKEVKLKIFETGFLKKASLLGERELFMNGRPIPSTMRL